ncbi:MAG: TonB-dependent receptor [Pseudomonadales bacterium]|nr:TonB-dependent receptor [Pseudomonadales bacterium]
MSPSSMRRASLAAAVSLAIGVYAAPSVHAQGAIEEVVVTGSYIRGTPEDAALPVDVIDRAELESRGSPNMLDIIRAMPYMTAVLGETNQFGANQGTIGTGSVNLRGLGGMRTLVLMNGRRTTYTPAEGPAGVDTNLLPIAAIGRIEVLKDGAAATYGSDAIAGVVNFITRRDLDGVEVNLDYRGIDGSDGDMTGSINWGWVGDRSNVLVSYAQQRRSELKSTERDWTLPPFLENPTGWSAFSMPGHYIPFSGAGTPVAGWQRDANCAELGGVPDQSPLSGALTPRCNFTYIPFDNLVEETEQQQIYAELNTEISDGVELHLEGLWAETILPDYRTSPGYPPLSGPNGPGVFQFRVNSNPDCPTPFCNNPGAATSLAQVGLSQPAQDAARSILLGFWRPHGWGGVPELTGGNGGQVNRNTFDIWRVSAGLKGTFNTGWSEGIGWDVAATYSRSEHTRSGVDNVITRLQSALNGLGGPNCNGIAYGLPGSTCLFYNPFSNAIQRNPALGLTNPGFVAANANSAEVKEWMIERWDVVQEQSLFVLDAVLDGQIPGFELPGGNIGWAFGAQYRRTDYTTSVTNPLVDAQVHPCVTPEGVPGVGNCTIPTGPFIFLGQFIPSTLDETVNAVFAELAIPILENLDAQLAVRYEDYGGLTGDTLDPKLSLRWQATDWLAFRGSAGTTFRGPTPLNKSLRATGLQGVSAAGGAFKAIDNRGDPGLQPETADTMSLGAILQFERFEAIVDYWNYKFEDQITTVPYDSIGNAVGNGPGNGGQLANCNHPLRDLVVFSNNNTCEQGVTLGGDIQRISTFVINGSEVEISGFDIGLKYDFGDVFNGQLTAGFDTTLITKYDVEGLNWRGVQVFNDYDAKGFANQKRFPGMISEMRAIANLNYSYGPVNARYEVRYVEGVTDDRGPTVTRNAAGVEVPVTFGLKVDDYYLHNLHFNWNAPWDTIVTLSIANLFDEDPPEVRHELSYDPYIGDPLGRTWKLGVKKTFAANSR